MLQPPSLEFGEIWCQHILHRVFKVSTLLDDGVEAYCCMNTYSAVELGALWAMDQKSVESFGCTMENRTLWSQNKRVELDLV